MMRTRHHDTYLIATLCLAGLLTNARAAAPTAAGAKPDRIAAFYFGNSLTGSSDPKDHEALGASAGKEWKAWAFLGAGWQLWQHRHALEHAGVEMKRDSHGDLTIDPATVQQPTTMHARRFFGALGDKWDAIVLQPFSMGLTWKCTQMWGVKFAKETDVGDIASAIAIIDMYQRMNPQGKVFIYQDWPAMLPGKIPPPDQLPEWARRPGARVKEAEFPRRSEFDYEKEWAQARYEPSSDPTRFWLQKNPRSKDYHDRLFTAIKARYPELWEAGRLRVIPVGDIFLALHRKMKAGQFPGCANVADFYTDVQHLRGGLPRYTVAASFFACLFDEHPGKLDWRLYNDESRYQPDKFHDALPLLEITPERAKIVHDTIWEIIQTHPDARPSR